MSKSKQYKLKQWYPSLSRTLNEGDIVEFAPTCPEGPGDNVYQPINRKKEDVDTLIDANEVENNPKFWEHVKEPLFATEDGVDIYEEDRYWYVLNDFTVGSSIGGSTKHYKTIARFSTKEKAEDYVKENKPRYSKNDIREAIGKSRVTTFQLHQQTLENELNLYE